MINAPNRDYCPICRTALFRPPHGVAIERALLSAVERLALHIFAVLHMILVIIHKVSEMMHALTNTSPEWLRSWTQRLYPIVSAWANANNIYWHADLPVTHCTNIRARNPDFSLEAPKKFTMSVLAAVWLCRYWQFATDCVICRVAFSKVLILGCSLVGFHGRFTNNPEKSIFASIVVLALVMHTIVTILIVRELCRACDAPHNSATRNEFMTELRVTEGDLYDAMRYGNRRQLEFPCHTEGEACGMTSTRALVGASSFQ
jgi:hypothetical protein